MKLTKQDQQFLLKLARNTIKNILEEKDVPKVDQSKLSSILTKKKAAFVTLTINSHLRGCIGKILPQEPLYKDVIENAQSAAFFDPRFPPLNPDELQTVKIEISILSIPKKLNFKNSQDLLKKLEEKKPGVIIKKGARSATYLPQVWKQLEDPKEFISSLCQKMGSSSKLWKQENLDIKTYNVFKFSES